MDRFDSGGIVIADGGGSPLWEESIDRSVGCFGGVGVGEESVAEDVEEDL